MRPIYTTMWDGKLMHLALPSALPGMWFKACLNPWDPLQVKSHGQGVANAVPSCLRCLVYVI